MTAWITLTKAFSAYNIEALESEINDFLKNGLRYCRCTAFEHVSTQFQFCPGVRECYCALVTYRRN